MCGPPPDDYVETDDTDFELRCIECDYDISSLYGDKHITCPNCGFVWHRWV